MKILFRQILVFFCMLVTWHVYADNITVQGEVSGHWVFDTVFISGDVIIPDGEYVMIHPGVRVIFQGVYEFKVEGSVRAEGWVQDSIYFTMADTAGFHVDTMAVGGWKGLRFDNNRLSNDSSLFSYCNFEFGKVVDTNLVNGSGGAVYVNHYDKVRFRKCTFVHNFAAFNGGAIYLDSANIVIRECVFQQNRAGLSVAPWGYGGAICSDNSSPEIYWNVFQNNSSTGVGGALAVRFKDCNIYNNMFTGNYSALGGGFGILHIPECTHRINTNLVAENASTFFGGGVANIDASPFYINNTIVDNQAIYGGGFYCKDSVSPDFYNTIIWGNTASVGPQGYLFEVYSQADFFYCDIQDGPMLFGGSGGGMAFSGAYESCIEANPEFLGTGLHPYELGWDSPCYDAGSNDTTGFSLPGADLAGNPRLSHAFIDIGAYEVVWVGVEAWRQGSVEVWPNPTAGKFQITNSRHQTNSKLEIQKVEIIDINGIIVLRSNCQLPTVNSQLDISHFPDGIYIARIFSGDQVVCKKLIKRNSNP